MGYKVIIATAITFLISLQLVAQSDEVSVSVNGKKIGKIAVADDPVVVNVNKMEFKKVTNLTITIKQSSVNRIYKRTLQITDENDAGYCRLLKKEEKSVYIK
jgi:thioredoxin-related protein